MANKKTSSKRADSQTKKALKGLRTEFKRLGKAVSKDLKARTAKHPGDGESIPNAAKRTKATAKKAAGKASTSVKKRSKAASKK